MKTVYQLIIVALVCLVMSTAQAQKIQETIKVDIPCFPSDALFKSLREDYEELPMFTGKVSDQAESILSIWLNTKDMSWSILATNKDITCIVGFGTDFKIIPQRKGTSI